MPNDDRTRLLPLEGAWNMRDLGGYAAADGRRVVRGAVYRSGDLDALTGADLAVLAERDLRSVVDFRDDEERRRAPDKLPSTVTDVFRLPIQPGALLDLRTLGRDADAGQMMCLMYRALVREARPEYRELFRILMDGEKVPLLFHCSAGKDRTGLAAALFLTALGVDRAVISRDYTLSADYLKEKYRKYVEAAPWQEPLFSVRPEFLTAAFDEMDENFGGAQGYLKNELRVDTGRLRALYTK